MSQSSDECGKLLTSNRVHDYASLILADISIELETVKDAEISFKVRSTDNVYLLMTKQVSKVKEVAEVRRVPLTPLILY
jgi:hypothetical protein